MSLLLLYNIIFGACLVWKFWGRENREEKWKERKNEGKKNRFKINKLLLCVFLNIFHVIFSII